MTRPRAAEPERRRRKEPSLALDCPSCADVIRVEPRDQYDGAPVHCARCGADSELSREYDERLQKDHWLLVEPEPDDEGAGH